jgi:Dna[CI] antecedent, DciA
MERASRVIGKLKLAAGSLTEEERACAAWTAAVGKRIAEHARAERLVRTKLVVGVDDAVWQRQLFHMSRMVLRKLQDVMGSAAVDDIEFRVAPPKRGPLRAGRAVSTDAATVDEADGIADDGLRRVYRASRKKELA